jgi:hypothetical protein
MGLLDIISRKTLKIRYKIVELVAPKLYRDIKPLYDLRSLFRSVPRPMTILLKNCAKTELVGVEIGVASGGNARNLLGELPIKKLWLVDPYTSYFEGGRVCDCSKEKEEAKRALSKFSQVVFVEKTSEEAVKDIDGNLDFVYIDGNHDYLFVKKDIELYYPLVKVGGVIGGHDYSPFYLGVIRAVSEFAEKHNFKMGIDFFVAFSDWWIIRKNGFRLIT